MTGAAAFVTLPATAVLELSFECGHSCVYCSCPWYAAKGAYAASGPRMGLDEYRRLVDFFVDGCGVTSFALSGGEPLMFEGFAELVEYISGKRLSKPLSDGRTAPSITVNTNGELVGERQLDLFAAHGVQMSVAFSGLRTYALMAGVRGASPERTLGLFEKAAARGIPAMANIVAARANHSELYNVMGEALLAGAASLYINRFVPAGRGLSFVKELSLDGAMLSEAIAMADDVAISARRTARFGPAIPYCVYPDGRAKAVVISRGCGAASSFFAVDPAGRIRPCTSTPFPVGDWKDVAAAVSHPEWKSYAGVRPRPAACAGCAEPQECRGGCPEGIRLLGRGKDPLRAGDRPE